MSLEWLAFWKRSKPVVELPSSEKCCDNSIWSDSFKTTFSEKNKNEERAVITPTTILPINLKDELIFGSFFDDNRSYFIGPRKGKFTAPIGFSQKLNIQEKLFFYHLTPDLNINETESPQKNVVYLPLRIADCKTAIGNYEKDVFKPLDGSPFSMYGIDNPYLNAPVLLVFKTDKGIEARGVYQKDGKPRIYTHTGVNFDAELDSLLRAVDKGKFKRPVWKNDLRTVKINNLNDLKTVNINNLKNDDLDDLLEEIDEEIKSIEEDHIEDRKLDLGSDKEVEKTEVKPIDTTANKSSSINWDEPKHIKEYLDSYVISQDDAKVKVSVGFSLYMMRVRTKSEKLPRNNILLIGPSGSGKTYMMELLSKEANLPFKMIPLVGKSAAGYTGENVWNLLGELKTETKSDAPYGIVFLDEIDKMVREDSWHGGYGLRIQNEMIGFLKGGIVNGMSTRNLLFVGAGAFHEGQQGGDSLESIVKTRLKKSSKFGFDLNTKTKEYTPTLKDIEAKDLIAFGLKHEVVGRFDSICVLNALSENDKLDILKNPKGSVLEQYKNALIEKGLFLVITDDAYKCIIERAPHDLGARGLSQMASDLFTPILFDPMKYAENKVIVVNAEYVNKSLSRQRNEIIS